MRVRERPAQHEPPVIPVGIKNYMTPQSHLHMQDELHQLLRVERPKVVETVAWAAGNGDRSRTATTSTANAAYARSIGASASCRRGWESAEVVDPKQQKKLDQVFTFPRPSA
jgi:transcription elongation factor GreB